MNNLCIKITFNAKYIWNECTVGPLITHTPWWTAQTMGFQGLWVYGGGKKISTHESHENFEKILFSPDPLDWTLQ